MKTLTPSGFLAHRELAAAVLLIIELVFLQQLVAAILQAALAPVLVPERCASHRLFRQATCPFYLFQTLPAAGSQRRREIADAEFLCLLSRPGQSECEAQLTASSALRLSFQYQSNPAPDSPRGACSPAYGSRIPHVEKC